MHGLSVVVFSYSDKNGNSSDRLTELIGGLGLGRSGRGFVC